MNIDYKRYSKISFDSRDVEPGTLFFCKGEQFKKEYLDAAIEKGAEAYVSETDYNASIPCIRVDDIRAAMAEAADEFYGHAWKPYPLIGITGSKGKTTTLYFLKNAIENEGKRVAYLSTVDSDDGVEHFESHMTTPEALTLHHHFANARETKVDAFIMEVSSQGLKYKRTDRVIFDIGIFLNFGRDHIGKGEHEDEEDYFRSKLLLMGQCRTAIINRESARFDEVYEAAKKSKICEKILTFSAKENPLFFEIGIPGSFNMENAVAATMAARELGISDEAIAKSLLETKVPGRMEVFKSEERDVVCISDYAHSTLSFEKLLTAVKEEWPGYRVEILFGCPGGKGLQRRTDLPRAAAPFVDFAWITEEDPGLESAEDICRILKNEFDALGIENTVIVDRSEAIKTAIENAKPKTVIVMTGKGREEYMHRGNEFPAWPSEVSQIEKYLK